MEIVHFHHPDWCAKVIRRHLGAELLDMFACFALAFATRGRSLNWGSMDRTPSSCYQSMRRLCRAGLAVSTPVGGGPPELRLTKAGAARQSPECRPESWWNRKWNGRWYLSFRTRTYSPRHAR